MMLTSQRGLDRQNMDIYDLMKRSRALITDYSSVYFDYLLLDRPIGFTLGDIKQYEEERGFVVKDPESLMPGEKLRSFEDLRDFIISAAKGEDRFQSERKRVNELANRDQSDGASRRILDAVGICL